MIGHIETLTEKAERIEIGRHRKTQLTGVEKNGDLGLAKPRFRITAMAPSAQNAPANPSVRVLLRNLKTMKYFQAGEQWTKNPRQAMDFRNGWWAAVYAFTMNPRHLVIDYEFDDERYNLHIPVLGHA